jgi:hypothetical protein
MNKNIEKTLKKKLKSYLNLIKRKSNMIKITKLKKGSLK